MTKRDWAVGDRVLHATKPEWGVGKVTAAERASISGQSCQRLTIRFDSAGLKTVSTHAAELKTANGNGSTVGWLEELESSSPEEAMEKLPDNATDPFLPIEQRLRETIRLYRYTGEGRSLIDWAISQSGLNDPLSRFSRHDLESLFQRFTTHRDRHLKTLAGEFRRQDAAGYRAVLDSADAQTKRLLQRVDR